MDFAKLNQKKEEECSSLPHTTLNMGNNQNNLSEQLQLLHELNCSDLDVCPTKMLGLTVIKLSRNVDTNCDIRFLDAIAAALTTGNPGDVFAAAFDKRKRMELVLAKNGPPTSDILLRTRCTSFPS